MRYAFLLLLSVVLCGCAVRKPVLALYCDQRTPDGKHCQQWASHTPLPCVKNEFGDCKP